MAVEDKYINSNVASGKLAKAAHNGGAEVFCMVEAFEVAAADDDGSVYRVFKNLPGNLIPIKIELSSDSITAGTDYELGLYETGVAGAAKDIDCLMGTTDLSSGQTATNGLAAVDIANAEQTLYELAGDTLSTSEPGYDVAVTANTVGSAAGTIMIKAWFIQG